MSRPVQGDQLQETPPEPARGADWPAQIVASPEATAVTEELMTTVVVEGADEQPILMATTL